MGQQIIISWVASPRSRKWLKQVGRKSESCPNIAYSSYLIIRVLLRDFGHNLNRSAILWKSGLESIDTLLLRKTSVFIFNLIFNFAPTQN